MWIKIFECDRDWEECWATETSADPQSYTGQFCVCQLLVLITRTEILAFNIQAKTAQGGNPQSSSMFVP